MKKSNEITTEVKQITLQDLTYDYSETENVFTDVIQIKVVEDTAHIEIGIRGKDGTTVKVLKNIIMTVPHFLKFTEVCKGVSTEIAKQFNQV